MKKNQMKYLVFSLSIFITALFILNFGCGGNDSSGVIPNISGNAGQSQTLVTKDVSGFVYANSSLSSKDGEDEETMFSILDIPLSGEDGFITQVNEYIQEDTSSKGSSPETEELLTAFIEEAGQYQPLPVWNSAANIYSSYADSLSTSPVPISPEGEISSSVLVDAIDDLISLDIEVSGEECYEAEAISNTDLLNSSDASGEYVLKSCPGKIIIKPGECEIFSVFTKPSVNLFDAGLQFSIANPQLGTVCGPIYLRCNGAKKYSVAYGVIYAKNNVETPLDIAINVTTSQGQSLSIPMQIVKKTAVVSGKVYASGPIVKGYVISQGPKSQCKINADGTYSLPKIWQGTGRKITATWWVMSGNQKVRYRETKFVNVFGDVTVDFGVVPTPTVRPPWDKFYDERVSEVLEQFDQWKTELGRETAIEKTVSWLNGNVPGGPPIPEEIAGAVIDEHDSTRFWLHFDDGLAWCLGAIDYTPINLENISSQNKKLHNKLPSLPLTGSDVGTVGSSKILMLAPFEWQDRQYEINVGSPDLSDYMVYGGLANDLIENGYTVDVFITKNNEGIEIYAKDPNADPIEITFEWTGADIVNPNHFENMQDYGIIYLATHANEDGIISNVVYERNEAIPLEDDPLYYWLWFYRGHEFKYDPVVDRDSGLWSYFTWETNTVPVCRYKTLFLSKNFFKNKSYNNSIVYVDGCYSWELCNAFMESPASKPKVYLGYTGSAYIPWARLAAYQFFYQMMYGFREPIPVPRPDGLPIVLPPEPIPEPPPMSVRISHNRLGTEGMNPDSYPYTGSYEICKGCTLNIDTHNNQYDDTYFPVPVTIIVHED